MSYKSLSIMSKDSRLMERVTACAALEGIEDPEVWVSVNRWKYTITPGWGEAYDYALSTDKKDPGADESVISDQMILTSVQRIMGGDKEDTIPTTSPTER